MTTRREFSVQSENEVEKGELHGGLKVRVQDPSQSTLQCKVPKGAVVLGVTNKNQAGLKKAITCARLVSLIRHHQNLEL